MAIHQVGKNINFRLALPKSTGKEERLRSSIYYDRTKLLPFKDSPSS